MFERLTVAEFEEIFEGDRRAATVKLWLREGISWHLGEPMHPGLTGVIGDQDTMVASHFLLSHGADRDPFVQGEWPFTWRRLEPLDAKRDDWRMRHANAFWLNEGV